MPNQMIFTVSLTDQQRNRVYSVYDGQRLVIGGIRPLLGHYDQWRDALISEMKEKAEEGFIVLVEEIAQDITAADTGGVVCRLDEPDEADYRRMRLWVALDHYFEMESKNSIFFDPEAERFRVRETFFDKDTDEKGRIRYRADWGKINSGHRAVLLAVIAAVREPISAHFLDSLFGGVEPSQQGRDLFATPKAILRDRLERQKRQEVIDKNRH